MPLRRAADQEQKSDSPRTEPPRCLDLRGSRNATRRVAAERHLTDWRAGRRRRLLHRRTRASGRARPKRSPATRSDSPQPRSGLGDGSRRRRGRTEAAACGAPGSSSTTPATTDPTTTPATTAAGTTPAALGGDDHGAGGGRGPGGAVAVAAVAAAEAADTVAATTDCARGKVPGAEWVLGINCRRKTGSIARELGRARGRWHDECNSSACGCSCRALRSQAPVVGRVIGRCRRGHRRGDPDRHGREFGSVSADESDL